MFTPGLVSISFRPLSPIDIIRLCRENGLSAVEWGGDVHAPDARTAADLRQACSDNGLAARSYGSYYKLAASPRSLFDTALSAAQALGAQYMRIWAGDKSSEQVDAEQYAVLADEASELADRAGRVGITLCLECHPNTLTDRWPETVRFLRDVGHPALKTYWQPNQWLDETYNLKAAAALAPYCPVLHVFQWNGAEHLSLKTGLSVWRKYLDIFADNGDKDALLEFMPDDSPDSLPEEAAALKALLAAYD